MLITRYHLHAVQDLNISVCPVADGFSDRRGSDQQRYFEFLFDVGIAIQQGNACIVSRDPFSVAGSHQLLRAWISVAVKWMGSHIEVKCFAYAGDVTDLSAALSRGKGLGRMVGNLRLWGSMVP